LFIVTRVGTKKTKSEFDGVPSSPGQCAVIGCKLKRNANEGCNSCASLAGLVLSFIACFTLLVIAPLCQDDDRKRLNSANKSNDYETAGDSGPENIMTGDEYLQLRSNGAVPAAAAKGAITSKIKHAVKHKTSPARLAQLSQPSLAFCFSLQPMTAYRPVRRHWLQAKTKC